MKATDINAASQAIEWKQTGQATAMVAQAGSHKGQVRTELVHRNIGTLALRTRGEQTLFDLIAKYAIRHITMTARNFEPIIELCLIQRDLLTEFR